MVTRMLELQAEQRREPNGILFEFKFLSENAHCTASRKPKADDHNPNTAEFKVKAPQQNSR